MDEEQEDAFSHANPNPTSSPPTNTPSPSTTIQTPPTTPTAHAKEEHIYDFMSDHPTPVDTIPIKEEEVLAATTTQTELSLFHQDPSLGFSAHHAILISFHQAT
eukprot:9824369-Ditylum_brightwellii.AAC.2